MTVSLVCAAVGLLCWPRSPGPAAPEHRAVGADPRPARRGPRALLPGSAVAVAGLLLIPALWWCWLPAGAVTAAWLNRRAPRPSAEQRIAQRRLLAGRMDVIAACLRSGLPPGRALAAVAEASGDPDAGEGRPPVVLVEVGALLAVGADPVAAWQRAAALPELATVAAAAVRTATGGTVLADAFTEQAAVLRRQNDEAVARVAGRAGVLMTAPLGACFLPAFLCLGLAPAVVGLLHTLHLW